MPEGFVSKEESVKLKECLLEISAAGLKLYSENEKHLLIRCRDSCKGSGCGNDLCKSRTYFTQHESNVIYAIHSRIPVVVSDEISTKPVVATETDSTSHKPNPKPRQWMTL